MPKFRVEFQNTSKGVRTQHGTDGGYPEVGKPGQQGYQAEVPAAPIFRDNPKGIVIHNVLPGAIGAAEMSQQGMEHFEKLGLIRVISKEPLPEAPGFVDLQTLLAENAALKARLAERGHVIEPQSTADNRKAAKA